MTDESKDMLKQLGLYADAITAFATVQLLTFIYLMAEGSCFTRNVLNHISVPIALGIPVNAAYFALVRSCHRAEDRIVAATEVRDGVIEGVVRNLRKTRCIILIVDCAITVGVLGLVDLGVYLHEFRFDCKC